jgi:predicted DCC family thiol-disulfide oxidoreductase YuxK
MLELSYLPYLELLLWGAIFARVPARTRIELFYDDFCNLCKGTVRTLRTLDAFGAIAFRPASTSGAVAAAHGIDAGELSVSIHGAFGGRVRVGYDLYLLLARRMPLLWPAAPLLWLGRLTRVGPWLYRVVAANRRRMFGTCKVAYDVNEDRSAHVPPPTSHWRLELISAAFTVLFIATLAFQVPYGGHDEKRVIEDPPLYKRMGFGVPDVFNATDLRMGDQWQVIYRDAGDGTWALVPLNAPDGSKLAYARYVDILYFGNSLRWRRLALEYDPVDFNQPGGKGYELTQRAIAFDDRLNGGRGGRYRVEVYRGFGSDPRRRDVTKYVPVLVHSYEVERIGSGRAPPITAKGPPST